jgi:alkenylglycerophosphocholine/alkenylglycerophosphoethanolamine hydrolase
MNKNQSFIFVTFATIYIALTLLDGYPFNWFLKIIPMLILIIVTAQQLETTADKIFLAGLVCSSAGDFLLTYEPSSWFIFGLAAFLVAHIFYIISLLPFEKKKLPYVAGYMILGVVMFSIIAPDLGDLFAPVFAYMSVLLLMAILTLLSKKSNKWLMLGGICFAISDSLLGINKFTASIPFASLLIMATYYLAQYSLVRGMFNDRVVR